jgi:hypothetical protein
LNEPVDRVGNLGDQLPFDAAVVLQHHDVVEPQAVLASARRVLDTRGVLEGGHVEWL